MTTRRTIALLALLALLVLPACEEVQYIDRIHYRDNPNQTYPGKECDWQVPNDTEKSDSTLGGCIDSGLVCEPTVMDGRLLPVGHCAHAQGMECTEFESAYEGLDNCNRGLRCQRLKATERNVYRCLPKMCINHGECASGESCQSNRCVSAGGTCGA